MDVYKLSYELKEQLQKDELIIKLNELDKKMSNNEEVMALAYQKDMAVENYSSLLKIYPEDSEEIKKARNQLQEAKIKLNQHPLIKEYLEVYSKVRDLYFEINRIIFGDFDAKLCKKE